MPLTDDGYILPELDDLIASYKQEIKDMFGQEVDVSDGSRFGMLARAWAEDKYQQEQLSMAVYDANFNSTATGISLDRRANNYGVQRRQAQYSSVQLNITGQAGYLVDEGTEFTTDNGDSFLTNKAVQIGQDGTATVEAHSAEAAGDTNVDANTIINQANPVDEIDSVTNPQSAQGGQDLEDDYSLRRRLNANSQSGEGPTPLGLKTAVLNVAGVNGCTVQVNNSKETDVHGNPPNTVHIYASGGNPQDIANKLADNLAGGATTVGSQTYRVLIAGNPVQINFDAAQAKNIYFKIDLSIADGFDEDAVKQAIQDYLDGFDMGDLIVVNRIFKPLYDLVGVKLVNSVQISTDGNNWQSDNLQLANYEIAKTNDDIVEVTTHD
jgi:uncharacterized phage protein gp47/JayE